jgi:two-component system, NtrC family, response regulator AtoC
MALVSSQNRPPPGDERETAQVRSPDDGALWLVVSTGQGLARVLLPRAANVTLGRGSECDVRVDDESVSRKHAVLHADGPVLTLEDLGSRNGTTVMGRKLVPGERAPIAPGVVVELGSTTLVVQHARAAAPPLRRNASVTGADEPVVMDATMRRIYALLEVIAPSPLNVLILGETGTGKEVFAEEVHARSTRAGGPFLRINCASLSGTLLESELFGYERGAFTGAVQAKPGLFEAADHGTLLLDEIGEMPMETQAKLLRVIENGEVLRLGSVKPLKVDVRFVAATNRVLDTEVAAGRFRADLSYRLNGFTVTLPPLRNRKDDVLPLAQRFAERAARRMNRPAPSLSADARASLHGHAWPGNLRELRNVIERAVVVSAGRAELTTEDLGLVAAPAPGAPAAVAAPPAAAAASESLREQLQREEKAHVMDALVRARGNQTEAAKLLGVSRRTLINKIEAYGIDRPRKK